MTEEKKPSAPKRLFGYFVVGLIAATASVLLYAGAQYFYQSVKGAVAKNTPLNNPASAESKPSPENADAGTTQLRKTSESFRLVAKKVGPAVVNITATKGMSKKQKPQMPRGKMRRSQPPHDDSDPSENPFFDFFEHFGMPYGQPPQDSLPQKSLGSGFIIDKKGTVVTNHHVVDGATEILVRLSDERTDIKAKLIGQDAKTDIAILKLEGQKDLPFVEWADSDTVEVGDWAIAIGNPFSLDHSVTVGIVSAKGRNDAGLGSEFGGTMIQTDAAINPGNSGGPLCDLDGKVMGVNRMIYTRSGGYMGIGFAIPSNLAKDVASKLVSSGKITRGWLGAYIEPLDPELAKELGIKDGVGIREVVEDSPAAAAGVQGGDIVLEVDGHPMKDVTILQNRISGFKPGEKVKIKLINYSDKKTRTVTVKIGELPDSEPEAKAIAKSDEEPDAIGLVVSTAKGKEGVSVEAVQQGSMAQMIGIETGDIIVKINRQTIANVANYKKLLTAGKRIYMEAKRKGRTVFFQFVVPEQ